MESNGNYNLIFENVWEMKDQKLLDEIVAAWASVGAIPVEQSALDRAKQVVYLIRDSSGEIAGISTAYISFIENLKNHFFVFRCMIFPKYRGPGLLGKLTTITLDYLESIHKSIDKNVVGVITEVESKDLQALKRAVLHTGFTFIGYSKRNNPTRVYYFKGAELS